MGDFPAILGKFPWIYLLCEGSFDLSIGQIDKLNLKPLKHTIMLKKFKLWLTALLTIGVINGFAQNVRFDLTPQILTVISDQNTRLTNLKNDICNQVDAFTAEVTANTDGSLQYPTWVKFVQIAEEIERLNDEWNEAYGDGLIIIIDKAIDYGVTDVGQDDERGKDLLADIIEEQHLLFPADIASVCFEEKFGFNSLRKCLEDEEDDYLENSGGDFDPKDAPTIKETIDDEEYWTLMTCDKKFTIANKTVTPQMLDGLTPEQQRTILETIQDIVGIIQDVVNIVEQLHGLLADCAGTTTSENKDIRNGFEVQSGNRWIGYVMVQKGITFDFANKTSTKIKGKAKVWKLKSNGKKKKDRKIKVGISFCAKEWNACEATEWPSDPGPYKSPRKEKKKKVKLKHTEPKALAIEYTTHYLQFRFGLDGIFEKALNLLGSDGCVRASNTDW